MLANRVQILGRHRPYRTAARLVARRQEDSLLKQWDSDRPDLCVTGADGTRPTRLTNLTKTKRQVASPTWSPNGEKIAFMTAPEGYGDGAVDTDLYVIDADGTDRTLLAADTSGVSRVSWGKR
jgi:dipeptidyl aminopeptidase/acylaminoacyl peptidase